MPSAPSIAWASFSARVPTALKNHQVAEESMNSPSIARDHHV
jgi:hypothetical protein